MQEEMDRGMAFSDIDPSCSMLLAGTDKNMGIISSAALMYMVIKLMAEVLLSLILGVQSRWPMNHCKVQQQKEGPLRTMSWRDMTIDHGMWPSHDCPMVREEKKAPQGMFQCYLGWHPWVQWAGSVSTRQLSTQHSSLSHNWRI